jgi:integrase
VLLGKYDSPESRAEYRRVLAEWEEGDKQLRQRAAGHSGLTVNELLLAFWRHAEQHYRGPDAKPTKELADFRLSLMPLKDLYGHTLAAEFGPLALKTVRQKMIDAGLCRGVINQRTGRIRRVFKWAVENQLLPRDALYGLQAVAGLQRGRSPARETEPVKPVPELFVEAVLPHLPTPIAGMIRLQLLAGMRPGEVVIMRSRDLDTRGKVWIYRPGSDCGPFGQHKTAWRGHQRRIAIGPRGQEVLRPFLKRELDAYLFSPAEAADERRALRRKQRKSPVPPSQRNRRKVNPQKQPGDHYTVASYGRAIKGACRKADVEAHRNNPDVPVDQVLIPDWHPNQLRHTKATEIRGEYGLDGARVALGHRSPQVTEVYAELDFGKAMAIAEKLG